MAKIWVLDTETKGTGAHMVPLDTLLRKPEAQGPAVPPPQQDRRPPRAPDPAPVAPPPRRFRVIDLMTRRVLVDDADARATVDALREVRSIVDVDVQVSEGDDGGWRPLSLAAQKKLWAAGH